MLLRKILRIFDDTTLKSAFEEIDRYDQTGDWGNNPVFTSIRKTVNEEMRYNVEDSIIVKAILFEAATRYFDNTLEKYNQ